METDISSYFESWSNELTAKANRVRNLIGDAHWLTDGQHKEELLKSHLKNYLSGYLRITRGFVVDPLEEGTISKEIDILISGRSNIPALMIEDDLTICLASSVLGHIEVKTSFSQKNVKAAIRSSIYNQAVVNTGGNGLNTWRAIFFFQKATDSSEIDVLKSIKRVLEQIVSSTDDIENLKLCIPNVIIIMGVCVIFIGYDNIGEIKLRMFDAGTLSAAIGILDLFSMVCESDQAEKNWDFSNISSYLNIGEPQLMKLTLSKVKA